MQWESDKNPNTIKSANPGFNYVDWQHCRIELGDGSVDTKPITTTWWWIRRDELRRRQQARSSHWPWYHLSSRPRTGQPDPDQLGLQYSGVRMRQYSNRRITGTGTGWSTGNFSSYELFYGPLVGSTEDGRYLELKFEEDSCNSLSLDANEEMYEYKGDLEFRLERIQLRHAREAQEKLDFARATAAHVFDSRVRLKKVILCK